VLGKMLAPAHAGEDMAAMKALQALALWSVTHDHQARGRVCDSHLREGAEQRIEILLRRDPADEHDDGCVGCDAPSAAQRFVASVRMEQPRIHAARNDADALEAEVAQALAQLMGRHHGCQRWRCATSAGNERWGIQPCGAVMGAVCVKVGVEVARAGDLQLAGGANARPAERSFGDHVHDIGALLPPVIDEPPGRRHAEPEGVVSRNRQPGDEHLVACRRRRLRAIGVPTRTDNLDVVAACDQPAYHHCDGRGDPVDFRRVGFGDHRHPQRAGGTRSAFAR
jgi:hypothetical protein